MIQVASVICGGSGPNVPGCEVLRIDNTLNQLTPCQAYQEALRFTTAEIICYAHDDLDVHDADWLERMQAVFDEHPDCVAVGLGGAVGLGTDDLYRKPYSLWNLARIGYASNQDDAETHGARFTGTRRVAVLEQFCMSIRTEWLRKIGGWPISHLRHHMLDAFIACQAARDQKQLWQVGSSCHHAGGASSTKEIYARAHWLAGGTLAEDHEAPHRWIFDNYRDVLPLDVRAL
jgi:GT2 family glycosyltransferase